LQITTEKKSKSDALVNFNRNVGQFTARTTTVTVHMYCWRLREGGGWSNQSNAMGLTNAYGLRGSRYRTVKQLTH